MVTTKNAKTAKGAKKTRLFAVFASFALSYVADTLLAELIRIDGSRRGSSGQAAGCA